MLPARILRLRLKLSCVKASLERMVDLNSASIEQLQTLPGVDLRAAYDLLLWRPYLSWDEVAYVPEFSEDRAAELRLGGATVGLPREPRWLLDEHAPEG